MAEFASQAVGSAGLTTGIIGTALGALNSGMFNGVGLLGGSNNSYVSRETFDLSMQLAASQRDNAILTADLNTEKKMVEVYNSLNDKINRIVSDQTAINSNQAVYNCSMNSAIAVLQNQTAQLMGMTKTVIPNASVCPGWGTATVTTSTGTATA